MRRAAMFEEENTLPGAELHPAVGNRYDFARTGEDGANVRGAVVAAFRGVLEVRRLFRHEPLEEFFQISPRRWVGIFHDEEAATRVPNENRDDTILHSAPDDEVRNPLRDLVGAFAAGRNGEGGRDGRHDMRPK